MNEGTIMGIIFIIFIVLPTIIGAMILIALKILKGGKSSTSPTSSAEETKMIQEIYHSLTRMEERVNILETILLENERQPGAKQ